MRVFGVIHSALGEKLATNCQSLHQSIGWLAATVFGQISLCWRNVTYSRQAPVLAGLFTFDQRHKADWDMPCRVPPMIGEN